MSQFATTLRGVRFLLLIQALCGCSHPGSTDSSSAPPGRTHAVALDGVPEGLSGLAKDSDGDLWVVAESVREVVRIDTHSGLPTMRLDIVDVPAGLELESVAILSDGRFVFGTESDAANRAEDRILFATRSDRELRVVESVELPYQMWNLHGAANEGVEAACSAGDVLAVACEGVVADGGSRVAPLAFYDTHDGTWSATRLKLTSDSGKIAALACRQRDDAIEFVAIERHFGVRRILHWVSPIGRLSDVVVPEILADLTASNSDNLEGIEWTEEGELAIVDDNSSHSIRSGPGKLLLLTPPKTVRD